MTEVSEEKNPDEDFIWERILLAVDAAMDKKALDPVVLDLREHSQMADYFLIVSGRSDTQVRAIAESIGEKLRHADVYPLSVEGEQRGQWVLLDYGDFIVHAFYGPTRDLYALEKLWDRATERALPADRIAPAATEEPGGWSGA